MIPNIRLTTQNKLSLKYEKIIAPNAAACAAKTKFTSKFTRIGAEIDARGELLLAFGDKRVVLVFLPVSESTYVPLHPNGIADVEAARLAAQAAAAEADVDFLDLSTLRANDDLFGDGSHLNQRGSAIVTTEGLTFLSR